MLKKILKFLFSGTIKEIETEAVYNYEFSSDEMSTISHYGSLYMHDVHMEELGKLYDEMYSIMERENAFYEAEYDFEFYKEQIMEEDAKNESELNSLENKTYEG